LNTQSFLSFQIIQAPRVMREFNPLRTSALTTDYALSHQTSKERSVVIGASEVRPTLLRI
jgi:hypothetical protein